MHNGLTILELEAIVESCERELMDAVCDCGAKFGDHSHDGHFCPDPNGFYLETRYRDAETHAATLRDMNRWIVERGANA